MAEKAREEYVNGYDESVLRMHRWRSVDNCCGYMRSELTPGKKVLDVGCGAGTITADMAALVAPGGGEVWAVDYSEEALGHAREFARRRGADNVRFRVSDVYSLDFDDDSFDVVHAHQLLQHLGDPVAALREMRRVARPGGAVCVREADLSASQWWPPGDERLRGWVNMYIDVTRAGGGSPDASKRLHVLAVDAGFRRERVLYDTATWSFTTPQQREFWCDGMARRALDSAVNGHAKRVGAVKSDEEMRGFAQALKQLQHDEFGAFIVLHSQIFCRK